MTQGIKMCREVALPGTLVQAADNAQVENPQNMPVEQVEMAKDFNMAAMSVEMQQERLISALETLDHTQIANVLTDGTENIAERLIVMANKVSIAMLTTKMWANGRVLRIAFMGGDPIVRQRVTAVAKQWEEIVNLTFDFVDINDGDSNIRIAFQPGDGSWSYIGTDAIMIPQDEPTMNFGWLTSSSSADTYNRVVLHEFGHALGAIHEHQHPEQNIPWNKEAVYDYYAGAPNYWSKSQVDTNLFKKYAKSDTNFSAFDPLSIMLYPITNDLTIGDWEVGWNSALSENDNAFMRQHYPGKGDTNGSTNGATNGQTDDNTQLILGEVVTVEIAQPDEVKILTFTAQTSDSYIFETMGGSDTYLKLHRIENDSSSQLVQEDDDNGDAYNARIVAQNLAAGTYQLHASLFEKQDTDSFQVQVRTAAVQAGRLTQGNEDDFRPEPVICAR